MTSPALDEFMSRRGVVPPEGGPPAAGAQAPVEPVPAAPPQAPSPQPQEQSLDEQLPVIENPEDVMDIFVKQNGRAPLMAELRAIRALPIIARQLGRPPTKRELLAFLDGRNETPPPQAPEYEVAP